MATEHKNSTRIIRDGKAVQRQRIVEHTPTTRSVLVSRISNLLWLVTAVLAGLISLRFFLRLMGANPGNTFVEAIVNFTDIFVAPFNGIFSNPTFSENAVFDTAALMAVVIYILGAWVVITLFRILFASTRSTRSVSTVERYTD